MFSPLEARELSEGLEGGCVVGNQSILLFEVLSSVPQDKATAALFKSKLCLSIEHALPL